jgi:hypothetical protein
MLGTLPKLADKAFVLGFLLPVFLFVMSVFALFSDVQIVQDLLDKLAQKDAWEKFAYFALLVWGLAILMMMLNHTLYQMLEGYWWPLLIVKWSKARQLARFDRLTERLESLAKEWGSLGDAFSSEKKREYELLRRDLVKAFPTDPNFILPTRFGNAIRAFEFYSQDVYGADSIPLWIHLATVVAKEFQGTLEDARAQVDCLVNLCFFAAIIGMTAAIRFALSFDWSDAISINPLSINLGKFLEPRGLIFGLTTIGAILVVRLAYGLSIERVHSWGSLVKAAFDCYLPALAKRLGYRLPTTGKRQRDFWTEVSRRAIYHLELNPKKWPRADAADGNNVSKVSWLEGSPDNVQKDEDNVEDESDGEGGEQIND